MDGFSGTPTLSERMAAYIHGEHLENIDAATVAKVKHIIAYHVGLSFRGLRAGEDQTMRAVATARELSEGGGSASLIGHADKTTIIDAVFANCQMMRSFGFDDVIFKTGVHPALVTLPIALALTERYRASGADLITSIIVGYEMLGKFAQWTWSMDTPRRATMTFGPFGSVATAAKLFRLDHAQTTVALGYAAHTAMGLAESDSGPISHYYGMVCRNGLTGAYLAKAGAWASSTVLEGQFGFVEAFLGSAKIDEDAMIASFGHDFAVMESCEKRYPGTGLNQVPIELLRALIKEEGLTISDIAAIKVEFPIERKNFGGGHGKGPFIRETSPSSCAFQFGALLLDGDLVMSRYDDVNNPAILGIVDKTTFVFVTGKPVRYARLEVRTARGETLVREGDEFHFEPESARTIMERDADGMLPKAKIERFLDLLDNLEHVKDASELVTCLTP